MQSFPPISDYGLIGDTVSAALISRQGSIDWLCWPRFDSGAVFLALLDREKGGCCEILSHDGQPPKAIGRKYRPGTLILETRIAIDGGELTVVDFMPVRDRPDVQPGDDTDLLCDNRIVRRLRCDQGVVRGKIRVWPTFDYANPDLGPSRIAMLGDVEVRPPYRMHPSSGGQRMGHFYVEADRELTPDFDTGALFMDFELKAGEQTWLVLTEGEFGRVEPLKRLKDVEQIEAATEKYWTHWSNRCGDFGEFRQAVCRSLIVLKALTYSPTGAIIAAPTLGLPEWPGGPRNYDYRYTWIRDAGFTVRAFIAAGYPREAKAFLRFLVNAETQHGKMLPVMLNLDGVLPPKESRDLTHLSGYRDSRPLGTGNEAQKQIQHDAWGESLNAIYSYIEMTGFEPIADEHGRQRVAEFVTNVANMASKYWDKPDRGIWENRDGDQNFFHSRVMCWLALDRAVKLADVLKLDGQVDEWREKATRVRAEYLSDGWNEKIGAYTQALGSDVLDAAVLRGAFFDAIDMKSQRGRSTLDRVRQKLAAPQNPDLIYRYRVPDGMSGPEGCFLSCSYWVMGCLALAGRVEEARKMLHRLLGSANDLSLMSEEIDPGDGTLLGNYPQAFTHMCVVIGAVRLQQMFEEPGK